LNTETQTCIIIPCYNEEKKFPLKYYYSFLDKSSNVILCFVNDGSSDKTLTLLENLKTKYPDKVSVVTYTKNVGKAEAVRKGIQYCNENYNHTYIGYLDADLSSSIQECVNLRSFLDDQISFAFGSRILIVGSTIQRSRFRHFTGRVIATLISNILKLKVYDTQCGCKLFKAELAKYVFKDPFISKWLFDVETFFRIMTLYGRKRAIDKMIEVPLKRWVDEGDSKVKPTYFFKIWSDLYKIHKAYKNID